VPRGNTQLLAGDKIIFMGTPDAMQEVERLAHPARGGGNIEVTIIGGGDVGLHLAERLEKSSTCHVRIMEKDRERGEMLAARLKRTLVLNGDGTDLEFLESENIGRSDVLVSVIDNDERNLLASLLARQLGVPKVVTRVGRPTNLRLFERVGIDVALSARGAAVASILHQITGGTSSLLAVIEHGEARVLELVVSPRFEPKPLKGIGAPADVIVGAILRGREVIIPRGDDRVEPGDHIIVFSTRQAAERVQAYFSGTGAI
jgi:trk system potassium uptake protein TrkA